MKKFKSNRSKLILVRFLLLYQGVGHFTIAIGVDRSVGEYWVTNRQSLGPNLGHDCYMTLLLAHNKNKPHHGVESQYSPTYGAPC